MLQVDPGALRSAARSFNSSAKEWRAAAGRSRGGVSFSKEQIRWMSHSSG